MINATQSARPKPPRFSYLLKHPNEFLAFGFGSGLAPKAPGTFGTLAAVPIAYFLLGLNAYAYLAVLIVTAVWGIYLCGVAARAQQCHDHPGIVWDEFVGYWITLFLAPQAWEWLLIGFVLFRFFDIVKPWPIRLIDKNLHGGVGIMLDDILAGLFAWVCLQGLLWADVDNWLHNIGI